MEYEDYDYPYCFGGPEIPPDTLGELNTVGKSFKRIIAWDLNNTLPNPNGMDIGDAPKRSRANENEVNVVQVDTEDEYIHEGVPYSLERNTGDGQVDDEIQPQVNSSKGRKRKLRKSTRKSKRKTQKVNPARKNMMRVLRSKQNTHNEDNVEEIEADLGVDDIRRDDTFTPEPNTSDVEAEDERWNHLNTYDIETEEEVKKYFSTFDVEAEDGRWNHLNTSNAEPEDEVKNHFPTSDIEAEDERENHMNTYDGEAEDEIQPHFNS